MKNLLLALVLVTYYYTCQSGDTLTSVANKYYTGGPNRIEFQEFKEGIKEINYDTLGNSEVWIGLTLAINRWEND